MAAITLKEDTRLDPRPCLLIVEDSRTVRVMLHKELSELAPSESKP